MPTIQALSMQIFLIGRDELGRDPRPLEVAGWRNQVQRGLRPACLRRRIGQSREAILARVYPAVMRRPLTPRERDVWLRRLPPLVQALDVAEALQAQLAVGTQDSTCPWLQSRSRL